MEVSNTPISRDMRMISTLSMPIRGRSTGREVTSSVTPRASMVWLATWPRDSPVTRAPALAFLAMASAMRIMNRRMMRVKYSSGQFRRISSWISVKGTMWTSSRPVQAVSSRASSSTLSWACWEV